MTRELKPKPDWLKPLFPWEQKALTVNGRMMAFIWRSDPGFVFDLRRRLIFDWLKRPEFLRLVEIVSLPCDGRSIRAARIGRAHLHPLLEVLDDLIGQLVA